MEQLIQEALEKANARSLNSGITPHSESCAYFIFLCGTRPGSYRRLYIMGVQRWYKFQTISPRT